MRVGVAAATPRVKTDTAARARRNRRRQRMIPENGADRSVGRGRSTQCPSASTRPPGRKVERHPLEANAGATFPRHDGARPARGRSVGEVARLPGIAYSCGKLGRRCRMESDESQRLATDILNRRARDTGRSRTCLISPTVSARLQRVSWPRWKALSGVAGPALGGVLAQSRSSRPREFAHWFEFCPPGDFQNGL